MRVGVEAQRKSEPNLFDFGEAELEGGVDPCENLRPSDEVSRVHHADIRRHFLISLSLSFSLSLSLRSKRVLILFNGSES